MQPETPQANQPAPVPPAAPAPVPQPPEQNGQSFYQPSQPQPASYAPPTQATPPIQDEPLPSQGITWEASEYVHVDKGGAWLVGLGLIAAVAAGVAIWFGAWTFAIVIVVMAVAFAIFAFRPPRTLHYTLDDEGIIINDKEFMYADFRAFSILQDGAFFTMTLIPVKRFAPALSVYFAEAQGEQIVDIVGGHLPMEHAEPDMIDNLMRRLRF